MINNNNMMLPCGNRILYLTEPHKIIQTSESTVSFIRNYIFINNFLINNKFICFFSRIMFVLREEINSQK